MKTWVHLLASAVLAALLYSQFKWNTLFILGGGVVIDIDHYFWYIFKYRNFSLIECYKHYTIHAEQNMYKDNYGILLIFHTIEFLAIIILLSFYFKVALIFAIGLILHYLLDLVWLYFVPRHFIANHSVIYWTYKQIQNEN